MEIPKVTTIQQGAFLGLSPTASVTVDQPITTGPCQSLNMTDFIACIGCTGAYAANCPRCLACPTLTNPANGNYSVFSGSYPTTSTLTCASGYCGGGSITCQVNAVWTTAPACTLTTCAGLPAPANGTVSSSATTTYGGSVTYACNSGYSLTGGSTTRFCTAGCPGVWNGTTAICTPIPCPALSNVAGGTYSPLSGSYGSTSTLTCTTGYCGGSVVTCQSNGTWSSPTACLPTTCPALSAPANGAVSSTSATQFGGSVSYTCNAGYILSGNTTRVCGAGCPAGSGVWSGTAAVCNIVTCPTLVNPSGGTYSALDGAYGATSTLVCASGYCGGGTATCQANGVWSDTANCTATACPGLSAPANGAVSSTAVTAFGGFVTYTCNSGYTRTSGSASRVCGAGCPVGSGVWSGNASVCSPVACPTLTNPSGGVYSTLTGSFGTNSTLTCSAGYCGGSTIACQANGTWTSLPTTCTITTCPGLPAPANGGVSSTATTLYGGNVTFTCNAGYNLNGNATLTCGAGCPVGSGVWSSSTTATCTIRSCPVLTNPAGGSYSVLSGVYGVNTTLNCSAGYCGGGVSTCMANGTWSSVAVCALTSCVGLTAPTNGNVSTTAAVTFGTSVNYACNTGYTLSGNSSQTCGAGCPQGAWIGTPPVCTIVSCPTLTNPTGGTYSNISGTYGSNTALTCSTGYCGGGTISCQANGAWSSGTGCTLTACAGLTNPINGAVSSTASATFNGTVFYTCNTGYNLVGSATRTCGAGCPTGVWSVSAAICNIVSCPGLSNPSTGAYSALTGNYLDTTTLTCLTGSCGGGVSTCQANGNWSSIPACTFTTCPGLTAPANGNISSVAAATYLDTRTFTCNTGYTISGSTSRACGAGCPSGSWSGSATVCTIVSCPTLTNPVGGTYSVSSGTFGNSSTLTCTIGYCGGGGGGSITCQANGTWTTGASCNPTTCAGLSAPLNGAVSSSAATVFGDSVNFTCNAGYTLSGSASRTCGAGCPVGSGVWDGSTAVCTIVSCPTLANPTGGTYSALSGTYGSNSTLTCSAGYCGGGIVVCQASGVWTTTTNCTMTSCPALSAPANGYVSSTAVTAFGGSVSFTCNTGYTLTGSATRTCGVGCPVGSGAWSGSTAVCVAVPCPSLVNPTGGSYTVVNGSFGMSSTLVCATGYCGGSTISCQANGTWTTLATGCAMTTCPGLTAPVNGTISSTAVTPFGGTISYTCNVGNTLVGSVTQTCGGGCPVGSGVWNGTAAICTSFTCPTLTNPPNGVYSFLTGAYGTVSTLTCTGGFCSGGNITCQANATWTTAPTCNTLTSCPGLSAPANGAVSSTTSTACGGQVNFTCSTGYTLVGSAVRVCGAGCPVGSGVWSGTTASCVINTCPVLVNPVGGTYSTLNGSFGSTSSLTCSLGYCGGGVITCQANSTWSSIAACTPTVCPGLPSPANGLVSNTSAIGFGGSVSYTCNIGYNLTSGSATRTCGAGCPVGSGVWDGSAAVCTIVPCPALNNPTTGTYSTLSGNYTTISTLTCAAGYCGGGNITCQASGTWSTTQNCVMTTCPGLSAPTNGDVSSTAVSNFGTTVTFSCQIGYTLGGSASRTCGAGCPVGAGVWSGTTTTCTIVSCPTLSNSVSGTYSALSGTYGSVVTLSCSTGYCGGGIIACQDNGLWDTAAATCSPATCLALANPANGNVSITSDATYGTVVNYTCNIGYNLSGTARRTCGAGCPAGTGQWSGSAPTCNIVTCPALANPTAGAYSTFNGAYGTASSLTCALGYCGGGVRMCQANGSWTEVSACVRPSCPALTAPAQGNVSISSLTYGSVATFTCNPGYVLSGSALRQCGPGCPGVWSGAEVTCLSLLPCSATNAGNGDDRFFFFVFFFFLFLDVGIRLYRYLSSM